MNAAKNFNKGRLIVTFRRNKKFINYMLFASFFAAILNQSLIFLSSVLISISVSGKLFMAHRLLVVPISLFTRALTDVNFQEFSEGQIHEIKNLYIQRLNMLFKYGFFPFFLAALVSPFLLPIILGEAWEDTGLYASCLLPGLFVQFVIAPFGTILWVVKRNKEFLYLTLVRLLVLLSFMYLGNVLSYGFGLAIGYSVGLIFGYVFQHILILRVLRSN